VRHGCVMRVELTEQDPTTSLGVSLAGGFYLGIPHERYLWRVQVIGRDPRVECLCGMKPRDGGAVLARGTGCPVRQGLGSPLMKTSCSVILRTDMFCGPGLRNLRPTHPYHGNGTDVRPASMVPLLLGG
jgi:hypothetical protein